MAEGKRKKKALSVQLFASQLQLKKMGLNVTMEQFKNAAEQENAYLYESEMKPESLEKLGKEYNFNPAEFEKFVRELGGVKQGAAPASGGSTTAINSIERVREVVAEPGNEEIVNKVKGILDQVVKARDILKAYLAPGCSFSIALKNPTPKAESNVVEGTETEETEDED